MTYIWRFSSPSKYFSLISTIDDDHDDDDDVGDGKIMMHYICFKAH